MEWQAVSSWFHELDDWKPVSRPVAWFALACYLLFLLYAAFDRSGFLFLDYANLAIHEAGHPLFGILAGPDEVGFGYVLMILGGTLLELSVPFACAVAFFFRREVTGVAFCLFWFFENFLYIGHYMASARTLDIQLVGSGDHDWEILFTHWNILVHDQQIGHTAQFLGWLGVLATVAWFACRSLRSRKIEPLLATKSEL
jgi:hypothetical protein